jgi:hypothetical protein
MFLSLRHIDDIKLKSPINTIPPKINRHINPSSNSTASETPMDTRISNGYKETTVISEAETEQSPENEEKLFNNLVKFVKDKLNTSTLSLTEFKKLLLLHPAGEERPIYTCDFCRDFRRDFLLPLDVSEWMSYR